MNKRTDSTQKEEKHTTTTANQEQISHQLIVGSIKEQSDNMIALSSSTLLEINIDLEDMVLIQRGDCRTIGIIVQDEKYPHGHVRINRTTRYNLNVHFNDIINMQLCEDIDDGQKTCVSPFKETTQGISIDLLEVYLTPYFAANYNRPVHKEKSYCIVGEKTVIHLDGESIERTEEEGLINYISYQDVGGASKQLKKITGLVELSLRYAHLFKTTGFEPPRALLYGPRGVGKRLMARGIANETGANFILIDGMRITSESDGEREVILSEAFEEANYVDYPGEISLKQIYGTFNRAMLKKFNNIKSSADLLTNAMVECFLLTQEQFTVDQQPHYVRGINEAIRNVQNLNGEELIRFWAHEVLHLFHDRLIYDYERQWTEKAIDEDELRQYIQGRLKTYYEEEVGIQLVIFNLVLDQVSTIDRVFRQPQGHLLLIGLSGTGKATLCRFVRNKYTAPGFNDDLRQLLRRSGCKREKIVFLLDESNVMDSSFLERINTVLANSEVPGLFEGDEYSALLNLSSRSTKHLPDQAASASSYHPNAGSVTPTQSPIRSMNPSLSKQHSQSSTVSLAPQ
ncbi:unnamed protein product [Adineta steineri]|uniref:Uncharacterized protein n=1 Tax=Adineta steineri TaxID=433720 RepID=A0A814TVX1_9BILA|nr:unnamed protein product [Adineta steineri]CAF1524630.1 unnamed protein product [Adineta steineri]